MCPRAPTSPCPDFFLNHVSSVYVAVVEVLNDTKQELGLAVVFKLFLSPGALEAAVAWLLKNWFLSDTWSVGNWLIRVWNLDSTSIAGFSSTEGPDCYGAADMHVASGFQIHVVSCPCPCFLALCTGVSFLFCSSIHFGLWRIVSSVFAGELIISVCARERVGHGLCGC